jgi:DNA polymerase-3 subunit epsilon
VKRAPPPPGPPWDLPVHEAPLAFLDLEMTGLDAEQDRIVELCIVRMCGEVREGELTTLVNPSTRAGGNAKIHGIDVAALVDAPSFAEVADACLALLGGAIVVGHAVEWDVRFLSAELRRIGKDLECPHFVDTLELARRSFSFSSYSLDSLCASLHIPRGVAHRAASDVEATRALFAKCVEALRPTSARDLWAVRTGTGEARPAIVEACVEAVSSQAPVVLKYRPAGRPPQQMHMILTEVRTDLDPPKVVGYQLPGRGRRELRADRILSIEPAPSETA